MMEVEDVVFILFRTKKIGRVASRCFISTILSIKTREPWDLSVMNYEAFRSSYFRFRLAAIFGLIDEVNLLSPRRPQITLMLLRSLRPYLLPLHFFHPSDSLLRLFAFTKVHVPT